jgi:hypothetical protein
MSAPVATTSPTTTTYKPSIIKYSDLLSAGLLEGYEKLVDKKPLSASRAGVHLVYRVGGRYAANTIPVSMPMVVPTSDLYSGVIAGLDHSLRKKEKASTAAMEGVKVLLASYVSDLAMSAWKWDDKYLL